MDSVWCSNELLHTHTYAIPKMVYYRDRVSTFQNWPIQLYQNKHSMASAGFYYTNNSDIVKCFSCGLQREFISIIHDSSLICLWHMSLKIVSF